MFKALQIGVIILMTVNTGWAQNLSLLPLKEVRLLDSPFKDAQEANLLYILSMEPDKLLAPFLVQAGLTPKQSSYGNWENTGLDGHIGGHYLTSLSLAWASTGDQRVKDRLDYMLSEMKRAQDANGDGYLGGVPRSQSLWDEIASGDIRASQFALNGGWVPLYNLHKTYAGLFDAYKYGESQLAREMLVKLGDWTLELTKDLTDSQIQSMLYSEHGGLNEVFADYYDITGKYEYLELARKFSEHRILDPLLESQDQLTGLHANTQIPKVVGFARIAQLDNNQSWRQGSEYFWNVVANERSVAIGGNSVREYFHDKHDFSSMIEEVQGPETCNTYNMIKLSSLLYTNAGNTQYVDFFERALYNHILGSQHPETGGLVYFTPMRPQHYRVYSQVDQAMWCCVGSGIESHFKYGLFVYAQSGNELFVNLFMPSRLDWQEQNVVIRQENNMPDEELSRLTIEKGGFFTLNIRKPNWIEGAQTLTLNGQSITPTQTREGYLSISRQWNAGDVLLINLPMKTQLESLPDGSSFYAVIHGPYVLSSPVDPNVDAEPLSYFADDSRMGHVASGPQCSLLDAPMFVSDNLDVLDKITRVPGDQLKFVAPNLIGNTSQELELIPFYRIHESRYMLYWQMASQDEIDRIKREKEEEERQRLELEARTVDRVTPGEQQPEVEHNLQGVETESGIHLGRRWRHAYQWFSYELKNFEHDAKHVRMTLFGGDVGRTFDLMLNDYLVATVNVDDAAGATSFYDVDYEVPSWIATADIIEFKLVAHAGSIAGGLFDLRLLRDLPSILDQVTPGDAQAEADHALNGEGTETGTHLGRPWRHAYQWFSYELQNPNHDARYVRMTLFGGDVGRTFDLVLNGVLVATVNIDGSQDPSSFYEVNYEVPDAVASSDVIEFKLVAHSGSIAGGLYGLKLLREL